MPRCPGAWSLEPEARVNTGFFCLYIAAIPITITPAYSWPKTSPKCRL
jgi:hypothetical protein